jgi:hypothetical protein
VVGGFEGVVVAGLKPRSFSYGLRGADAPLFHVVSAAVVLSIQK